MVAGADVAPCSGSRSPRHVRTCGTYQPAGPTDPWHIFSFTVWREGFSLSACYLPAWAAVVNFLDSQTHWKMRKTKDGRPQEESCRAGFAANEVNPSPNCLPGNMLLPTFFNPISQEMSFILSSKVGHISSVT
jgi:hypothetical protein